MHRGRSGIASVGIEDNGGPFPLSLSTLRHSHTENSMYLESGENTGEHTSSLAWNKAQWEKVTAGFSGLKQSRRYSGGKSLGTVWQQCLWGLRVAEWKSGTWGECFGVVYAQHVF